MDDKKTIRIHENIPGKPVTKALRLKTSKRSQIRTHLGGDDILPVRL